MLVSTLPSYAYGFIVASAAGRLIGHGETASSACGDCLAHGENPHAPGARVVPAGIEVLKAAEAGESPRWVLDGNGVAVLA